MAPKDRITIVLADDHALVRQGIKKILQEKPGLTVIAEARDGRELLEKLASATADLAIVDISMPHMGGLEAAAHIKKRYPQMKILVLTMHRDKEFLQRANEIGVDGYLLKEEMDVDLHRALEEVFAGGKYISPLLR